MIKGSRIIMPDDLANRLAALALKKLVEHSPQP